MSYLETAAALLRDALGRARAEIAELQTRLTFDRERHERELAQSRERARRAEQALHEAEARLCEVEESHREAEARRRTEESLRESEAKYAALVQQSHEGVAILQDGELVFVNQATCDITGRTLEEMQELGYGELLTPESAARATELMARRLAGEDVPQRYELGVFAADGTVREVEASVGLIDYGGRPAVLASVRDITETKEAAEKLQASEARWRSAVESAPGIVTMVDAGGHILFLNRPAFHTSPDEAVGMSVTDLTTPAYRERFRQAILDTIETRESRVLEVSSKATGEQRWFECHLAPVRRRGEVEAVMVISLDVTARRETEEALRQSRASLELLNEELERRVSERTAQLTQRTAELEQSRREIDLVLCSMPNLLFVYDQTGCFTAFHARPDHPDLIVPPSEFLGKRYGDVLPPHVAQAMRTAEGRARARDGRASFEYTLPGPAGVTHFEATIQPVAGSDDMLGVVTNITERKEAEAELRKVKTVTDAANCGIAIVDLEGSIDYVNDYFASIHGFTAEELHGQNLHVFHSDEQLAAVDEINRGLRETGSYGPMEVWHRHRDGTDFPMMMSGVVLKDEEGQPLFMACTALDITESKRAERRLAESEDRFRGMAESTSDWLWEVDEQVRYTYASPKVEDLLGYRPEELLGKTPFSLMPPDEAARAAAEFGLISKKREPFANLLNTNVHKDGRSVVLETSGVPIFDPTGAYRGYRGIDRDVTSRKAAEAQLVRFEKMAALGQLLAGVAHEINNPVNFIYGNLTLIGEACFSVRALTEKYLSTVVAEDDHDQLEEILGTTDMTEFFDDMKGVVGDCTEGARRVREIVQSLRSFAHPDRDRRVPTDVRQGLDNTLTLLSHELGDRIDLVRDYDDVPAVMADPAQLNQVFMNLLLNATQAISGEGRVHVSVTSADGWVEVSVADDGPGIPADLRDRIFEPFFTTKEIGQGTGLGLAICYGIVEAHGGRIDVASEPGERTTFTVRLPVGG